MPNIVLNMALIDWLTLSLEGEAMYKLRYWCNQQPGEKEPLKKKMNAVWYDGFKADEFFWGERLDDNGTAWGLFTSEGEIAHHFADTIWGMVLGNNCQCTRIDYQVTVSEPTWYDAYKARKHLEKRLGREVGATGKHSLGITLELNSRESERYLRLYEKVLMKGKKEVGRLLRLEYEYKGERARAMWRMPLKPAEIILGEIESLCTGRDYVSRVMSLFKRHLGEKAAKPIVVRRDSDTWRWIDGTVRQSFKKIVNQHDYLEVKYLKEFLQEFLELIEKKESYGD